MTTIARKILFACCVLLSAFLFSSGVVKADEYDVAFGVQTKRGQDFGSVTCHFGRACSAGMDSLGMVIMIHRFRNEPERAFVHLYSEDLSCCYFAGAEDNLIVNPQKTLSRVLFFSGRAARGYLLPQNEFAGTLYLKFRSH